MVFLSAEFHHCYVNISWRRPSSAGVAVELRLISFGRQQTAFAAELRKIRYGAEIEFFDTAKRRGQPPEMDVRQDVRVYRMSLRMFG